MELYIHIPFCIKKCNYCDFLSFPANQEVIERYCQALEEELRQTAKYIKKEENISTIFIGGGTPSVLTETQITHLFSCIYNAYSINPEAEISMEANPGTLTYEKLCACREAGVNRLSIGLQCADDATLRMLGRIHTWDQFVENYTAARKVGFQNINIDIMSSLPGQSLSQYLESLYAVMELEPEHISSYSLILEEGTPFYESEEIRKQLPDEAEDRKMYEKTKEILLERGYERYEISNYAKKGFACQHNLGYWDNVSYLGVGLGASSFYKDARFANERSIKKYIERPFYPFEQRKDYILLKKKDKMEDFMIFGLRKMAGISLSRFEAEFATPVEQVYGRVIRRYTKMGLLVKEGDHLRLSDAGIDVSNRIFEDFLLDNDVIM